MTKTALSETRQQVNRVLMITLVLNLLVAFGKIGIGWASGALAISADGFHSLVDGISNVVALVANRVADQPPDARHPYGHHRFETLAALALGALLLLTAWEILRGAIERLQTGGEADISPLTLAVLVGTLVINLFVSRYEKREGERLRSQVLLADAANTGADVFVTLSVLGSSIASLVFGWYWLDPVAALLIVVLIGRAAWQVLNQTGSILVDTAPYTPEMLTALVSKIPAVRAVERARSRGSADAAHIDLDIRIAPEMTAGQSDAIREAIFRTVRASLDGIGEIEVHFLPDNDAPLDYAALAGARAAALGLSTHEVRLSETPDGKLMELHVEVPRDQSLAEAHTRVSALEGDLRAALPDVAEVVTHIEPEPLGADASRLCATNTAADLEREARQRLQTQHPAADWHQFLVTEHDDGYALSLHVTLPAHFSVSQAHRLAEEAEMLLRGALPEIHRVTIHTEPPENIEINADTKGT